MKTLQNIQTLSKVGKILCKIVFIFCLVGGIGCAVGIVSLALLPDQLQIGGVTIHNMVEKNAEVSLGTCYAAMAAGIVLCTGEAVLCKIAGRYFKNELAAGTPFTFDGAREMIRLGICTICIPIGTQIIASIVHAVFRVTMADVQPIELSAFSSGSISLGFMFIVSALLCRHGAEISEKKEQGEKEE